MLLKALRVKRIEKRMVEITDFIIIAFVLIMVLITIVSCGKNQRHTNSFFRDQLILKGLVTINMILICSFA